MKEGQCVGFLQDVLPELGMRWPGFRKVRRQVCRRINRRLQELNLPDHNAYRQYLAQRAEEWLVLDSFCRISISRFYRDRRVFDLLRESCLPRLADAAVSRGQSNVRGWSAGCASGEEVYTLKMIWEIEMQCRFPELTLELVATDADEHMLSRARRGRYPVGSVKDFPPEWLSRSFQRSEEELEVTSEFRGGIQFLQQDIRRRQPPGPFDLICCRHLAFTYFDDKGQQVALRQLVSRLRAGGVLVVGKQETLPQPHRLGLQLVEPHSGVYRLVGVQCVAP